MTTPQLTPEQQEEFQRFNQLVQQLEVIRVNLQQLEMEKRDIENAIKETKNLDAESIIYRSAGRLLFQSNIEEVKKHLSEQQEQVEVRLSSLTSREKKLVASVKELQEKLMGQN